MTPISSSSSMGLAAPALSLEARTFAASIGARKPTDPTAPRDPLAPRVSPVDEARRAAQQGFASLLSESVAARSGSKATKDMTDAEKDAQARQTAEEFVAVAFVQPIFKNLRNSSMGAELPPPLGPGPGEKQFRSLADTQVARQLVHASNWPLVDNLTKRLRTHNPGNPFSREALAAAPTRPGTPADLERITTERTAAAAKANLSVSAKEASK